MSAGKQESGGWTRQEQGKQTQECPTRKRGIIPTEVHKGMDFFFFFFAECSVYQTPFCKLILSLFQWKLAPGTSLQTKQIQMHSPSRPLAWWVEPVQCSNCSQKTSYVSENVMYRTKPISAPSTLCKCQAVIFLGKPPMASGGNSQSSESTLQEAGGHLGKPHDPLCSLF